MSEAKYHVGQRVWMYDVNARGDGPKEMTVVKVGRKLVDVADARFLNRALTFRIDDATRNNNYRHQWLRTDEEKRQSERRHAAVERLASLRIRFDVGSRRLRVETLERIADLVEQEGADA